ncbi:MAG: hypothetical protein EA412_06460 [Chitinophagaceae bacterium]|nr:MAG: hypothetical protein EA412_06460 [Chitinophagaceae bacterium]
MGFYDDLKDLPSDDKSKKLKRIINSTLWSIISLGLAFAFIQLVQVFLYDLVNINSRLNLFQNEYIRSAGDNWRRAYILLIYGTPQVFLFIVGFISYAYLWYNSSVFSFIRVFLLWFSFYSLSIFCSYLFFSSIGIDTYHSIFYYGFSIIAAWLNLPVIFMIVFSIVGAALAVFSGTLLYREYIKFCYSSRLANNRKGRLRWLVEIMVLPYFFSIPFFILFMDDINHFFLLLVHIFPGFLIILGAIIKAYSDAEAVRAKKGDVLSTRLVTSIIVFIVFTIGMLALFTN